MAFMRPERFFSRITRVDIERDLLRAGRTHVLLDVDNTILSRETGEVPRDVATWLARARTAGVGFCLPYYGETAPPGTLACDGSEVSRQAYDKLFEKIGTAYGDGDGKETFNVPDWRGLAQRRCLPPDIKMPETKLYITYHEHTE